MSPTPADARGLTEEEAAARLARDGPNLPPAPQRQTLATAALAALRQPMVLLLLASTALYATLGSTFDSVVLGLSIVVVVGISLSQELRTQRVLEALRDLSSPRSTVVRGGVMRRIPSVELVVGDRLIVNEGDRLACDAELVEAHAVRIDESLLTGESLPVDKGLSDGAARLLHAGTLVVQGDGLAVVSSTGAQTTLGRIGRSVAQVKPPRSRLQDELQRLVRWVAVAAIVLCLLAAAVFAWRSGSWTEGLLVGLTLAMAIVPEEFAVVWTVMLALGAWRLGQSNVLTRQPHAIEALGATTVLCVDKTGTLTRNRMELVALHDGATTTTLRPDTAPPPVHAALLRSAGLASTTASLDPMDQAVLRRCGPTDARLQLVAREGVQPGRPFVSQRWEDGAQVQLAVKGAPEAVLALCEDRHGRRGALLAQAERWGAQGWRVLAVAGGAAAPGATGEPRLECLGLLAFEDPLRDEVPAAIEACRRAGVRVVMITGDAPATARAIAAAAGLVPAATPATEPAAVLTGAQLDTMGERELEHAVRVTPVFGRVTPDHKLRIVQALQRLGEVVAMTGDGVNDGPALRAAHIGVAMGGRGTDVAREAAALVLIDDRFASLVEAVAAGRRIFANLQHALGYLFAVHVPIVGASLLPLLGGPVLLLPIHVVLLELIIDPACSLVFESEPLAPDAMHTPPRRPTARLFSARKVALALAAGCVALLPLALVQAAGGALGWSEETLRAAALATIVAGNLALLWWFRGAAQAGVGVNRRFMQLLVAVLALGLAVATVAPLRTALGLPAQVPLALTAAMGLACGWALWRLPASVRGPVAPARARR